MITKTASVECNNPYVHVTLHNHWEHACMDACDNFVIELQLEALQTRIASVHLQECMCEYWTPEWTRQCASLETDYAYRSPGWTCTRSLFNVQYVLQHSYRWTPFLEYVAKMEISHTHCHNICAQLWAFTIINGLQVIHIVHNHSSYTLCEL